VEDEAMAAQQGVLPVRPPDVVGGGEAVHAEGLGAGQACGLGHRERRHAVVEDNDAAVGRGDLRQERGQLGPRAGAVGLEERLLVRRERGARVRGGGLVRGHVQRAETHRAWGGCRPSRVGARGPPRGAAPAP